MSILDYYIEKQKDLTWVNRFQSTAKGQCGKLFSCINVNYRSLSSFFTQLNEFKDKIGIRREDWNDYQDNGQEKDKHRIANLRNAGLIISQGDRYYLTEKGKEVLKIYKNDILSDREKWILLLMLILDYQTEDRKMDLIKSAIELVNDLSNIGVERTSFLRMLKDAMNISDKNTLFSNDVFWLITFFKDEEFIKLYLNSSNIEKEKLFNYVVLCSKNKNSTDCIAHKFKSSGAYTAYMFNEDINIVLSILIITSIQDDSWNGYLRMVTKLYPNCEFNKIDNFMKENYDVYSNVYNTTFALINQQIQ